MKIKNLIGIRIKEIRTQKGLTQEQLAEKAGLNPKYISGIERGMENPTLETFIKVSESLDTSIGNLFHHLEPVDIQQELERLSSLLEKSNPEKQTLAVKILTSLLSY